MATMEKNEMTVTTLVNLILINMMKLFSKSLCVHFFKKIT